MPAEHVPAAMRRVVAARAHDHCEYCQTPAQFTTQSFTVEHIQPRTEGGPTTLENLAWACFGCNSHKHTAMQAVDPETSERVSLYNPRQQIWGEHFEWNAAYSLIGGRTPCGRATVGALNLNRGGLVNLRRVLVAAGYYPPSQPLTAPDAQTP